MTVDVYWNSIRRVFSIRRNGRVISHATDVALLDATFHVSEKVRDRVRRTGHKQVHAVIRGELVAYAPNSDGNLVRYNPYETDSFVTADGPIHAATNVHLSVIDGKRPEVRAWMI